MRRLMLLCLILIVSGIIGRASVVLCAENEIVAVYGSTPIIDGAIDVDEWDDATSVSFDIVDILVKQDGMNLYVGFNISERPFQEGEFSIYLDTNNDKSPTLQSDDVTIVIYRDGGLNEANVTDGNWQMTESTGWTAKIRAATYSWSAEFNISYTKIGVSPGVEKTIGALFIYHPQGPRSYIWPPGAGSLQTIVTSPESWGTITSPTWIPEFPAYLMLPIFMLATLLTVFFYRRRTNHA